MPIYHHTERRFDYTPLPVVSPFTVLYHALYTTRLRCRTFHRFYVRLRCTRFYVGFGCATRFTPRRDVRVVLAFTTPCGYNLFEGSPRLRSWCSALLHTRFAIATGLHTPVYTPRFD